MKSFIQEEKCFTIEEPNNIQNINNDITKLTINCNILNEIDFTKFFNLDTIIILTRTIPTNFFKKLPKNLNYLSLTCNNIEDDFMDLKNINYLELNNCKLYKKHFKTMSKNIKITNLKQHQIKWLPLDLESLEINYNLSIKLLDNFTLDNFSHLQKLHIKCTKTYKINLKNLPVNLIELSINNNLMEQSINYLNNLKYLYIDNCILSTIFINTLPVNLTDLLLYNITIDDPLTLNYLINLSNLSFEMCEIKYFGILNDLPKNLNKLTINFFNYHYKKPFILNLPSNLKILDIKMCIISQLNNFENLTNITINKSKLNNYFFPENCEELYLINLSNLYNLNNFPKKLSVLHLENCKFLPFYNPYPHTPQLKRLTIINCDIKKLNIPNTLIELNLIKCPYLYGLSIQNQIESKLLYLNIDNCPLLFSKKNTNVLIDSLKQNKNLYIQIKK